eukprot:556887-Prymnesium_polylepis.1
MVYGRPATAHRLAAGYAERVVRRGSRLVDLRLTLAHSCRSKSRQPQRLAIGIIVSHRINDHGTLHGRRHLVPLCLVAARACAVAHLARRSGLGGNAEEAALAAAIPLFALL